MQNRYVGDIGDFSKLGLLRELSRSGLKIGVNWYLTPDENHNGDGRHIRYLENRDFQVCDEVLCRALSELVAPGHERTVAALEAAALLPAENTRYFHEELSFPGKSKQERTSIRAGWHAKALDALKGCDIIFVDPDNGLIVSSADGTARSNKYVLPGELRDYYAGGASVIYYQHKARRKDPAYIDMHNQLLSSGKFDGAEGLVLKFTKTSQRFYFMIMRPEHREAIVSRVDRMLKTPWGGHFTSRPLEGRYW